MTQYSLDRIFVSLLVLLFLMLVPQGAMRQARAQVSGKQLLQQLIEGARKEGQIDWFPVPDLKTEDVRAVAQVFNKRFGLNIRLNAEVAGNIAAVFSKALMESKSGLSPTFDVMYGPDHRGVLLWQNGGVDRIDNWEALLREISPETYAVRDVVSPVDLAGYAFLWGTRVKAMNYNTRLISEADLPKTHVELGDPKYKGMYPLPPFITEAEYGPLIYPKDRWLEVVRSWSALGPPIIAYRASVTRMLLGEFKFMPSNAYYVWEVKAEDPKAPIGLGFFKDFTAISYIFHVVRKGAKHPNAAKLFTLWATSPEANAIFESGKFGGITPNLALGTGPVSSEIKKKLGERGVKTVSWFDSKQTLQALLWYDTTEGGQYAKELSRAQTGRK